MCMLTEIELGFFKCFKKLKLTDLRNITILTGPNNVGKSAVFQAVIFLKNAIMSQEFNWSTSNLKDFKEVVYKHGSNENIGISCTFSLEKGEIELLKKYIKKKVKSVTYEISINAKNTIEYEAIRINDEEILDFSSVDDASNIGIFSISSKFIEDEMDNDMGFEILSDGLYTIDLDLSRSSLKYPLSWKIKSQKMRENPDTRIAEDLKDILKNKFRDIYYVSDKRRVTQWHDSLDKEPIELNPVGDNASVKLHYLHSDRDILFREIEKWIRKIDPEIKMLRTPTIPGGNTTIEFRTLLTDVNLLTVGSGINTVLPVIMQSLLTPDGSTILIEEPEIHLHRGAQTTIFDMFIERLSNENKQIIFTTHSYDLLLAWYHSIKHSVLKERQMKVWNINRKRGTRKPEEVVYKKDTPFAAWREQIENLRK